MCANKKLSLSLQDGAGYLMKPIWYYQWFDYISRNEAFQNNHIVIDPNVIEFRIGRVIVYVLQVE